MQKYSWCISFLHHASWAIQREYVMWLLQMQFFVSCWASLASWIVMRASNLLSNDGNAASHSAPCLCSPVLMLMKESVPSMHMTALSAAPCKFELMNSYLWCARLRIFGRKSQLFPLALECNTYSRGCCSAAERVCMQLIMGLLKWARGLLKWTQCRLPDVPRHVIAQS